MKYLAIAALAAVAAATPALEARDGWTDVPKEPAKETSTWSAWESTTTPVKETSTWNEWETVSKPDPTWNEWAKTPVYTTTVVTAITTYCPEPTKITHAGKTWTVTKATTLTITDCPCTISVPIYTKTSTSCDAKSTPVADETTWAEVAASSKTPVAAESSKAAETWVDASVPVKPAASSTVWSPVAKFTGAANKLNVGAGFAGVLGAAALLL